MLILVAVVVAIITIIDLVRINSYVVYPMKPQENIHLAQDEIYYELVKGNQNIDWNRLDGTLEYIQKEYDCADFRLVNLLRILYEFNDQIPESTLIKIEDTLFNFRFWWDDPGENSMCYWSENHQILFASAEYLVGQKYPEIVFSNSGLSGNQHKEKARQRILDWLEMRWNYGFTEFYSSVYYKEDIGALINLIDHAEDQEIVEKSKMIMDLLFYDVGSQNINTYFVTVSGRAYTGNRMGGPGSTLGGLTNYFWGDGEEIRPGIMYGMMTTQNYNLPPVIAAIARDTNDVVIRQSNGLDVIQLKDENYFGRDNRSMMMQWGMEAFTNPEVIRNSLSHIRSSKMFSNEFVKDFKILDFTLLKWLGLEPPLAKMINPQSNGVAIQKGNTYTYKTEDYMLYTVQKYHPGDYGDQQHVAGMNIGNSFSIFHNHPALEKDKQKQSPNYWVGYGHLPHAVQDSNVSLAIYAIPEKKGIMEEALLDYTHAYFPSELFDTTYLDSNYIFGKKGETYCAFITKNILSFREHTTEDLIQPGKKVYWITEAGSRNEDGSFKKFCQRIKQNNLFFDEETLTLTYQSKGKSHSLQFRGDFSLNGQNVNTEYSRFESPYCTAEKKAKSFHFAFGEESLYLNFEKMSREF